MDAPVHKKIGKSLKITSKLIRNADNVVNARNGFVHYKPQESSAQLITDTKPDIKIADNDDGTKHFEMSQYIPLVLMPNSKVVPSLVDKEINAQKSKAHYSAVRELLLHWFRVNGGDIKGLERNAPAL